MPNLTFSVDHSKETETAVKLIDERMTELANEHKEKISDLTKTWNGSTLDFKGSAMGLKISGQMEVGTDKVSVDLSLPMIAMAFKTQIIEIVKKEILFVLSWCVKH